MNLPRYGRATWPLLLLSHLALADVRVDGRGALTTSIQIEVPAYYGVAPHIALRYSSAAGRGLAGAGWSLDAASQIRRTSSTGGISRREADDRFWLDGQELVPCATGSTSPSCTTAQAAFGSSAGFFSTRVETRQRIQRVATGFVVWQPDGTVSEYTTTDGDASFQLATVTDTWGHTTSYTWSCATACELDTIRYGAGGVAAAAPGTEIRFHREPRPDSWSERTAAGLRTHGERLRSVVVRNHGTLLRAYRFGYRTGADTGASILTSVDQVGRDATVDAFGGVTAVSPPLPAHRFATASLGKPGAFELAAENTDPNLLAVTTELSTPLAPRFPAADPELVANSQLAPGTDVPLPMGFAPGDFDGDGRPEMLTWALRVPPLGSYCSQIALRVHPSGGGAPITTALKPAGTTATCDYDTNFDLLAARTRVFAIDVTGDGADDVVLALGSELRRYHATGSGRFVEGPVSPWANGRCTAGDIDHDGRDDLICEDAANRQIVTRRATPSGWLVTAVPTNTAAAPALFDHERLSIHSGDVDGDGLSDVVLARPDTTTTRIVLGRSLGDGTYQWNEEQTFAFVGELQTADIDGDGKLDLVFGKPTVAGSDVQIALAQKGAVTTRWQAIPPIAPALTELVFADVNADGRADMIGRTGGGDDLVVARANGNGGFGVPEPSGTSCSDDTGHPVVITPADWNGDGRVDPTCVRDNRDGTLRVLDHPVASRNVERARWQRGDVDGDGRLEMIYIEYRNPGYLIHVVQPAADRRVTFAASSVDGRLREPAAGRWVIADIGSPAGPADGKDDLVLVEHVAGRMITTTLLSTGFATFDIVQRDVNAMPSPRAGGWMSAVDDHDGRSVLVRTVPMTVGMRVEQLRPVAPGVFALTETSHFTASSPAPLNHRSVRGFQPADLDGDGLTDLVQVDAIPGDATVIRTLRANGSGGFVEATSSLASSTLVGPRAVRVVDLDGDGAADLVHMRAGTVTTTSSCLRITHLAGDGRGNFAPGALGGDACLTSTDPAYRRLLEDAAAVLISDLDRDGRGDLLHLTHVTDAVGGQKLVVTRIAFRGGWRVTPQQFALAFDEGDAWVWTSYRDPLTGDVGLTYAHPWLSMRLLWRRVRDEIASLDNGIGRATTISYGAFRGTRAYLPAGFVPRVVSRIVHVDHGATPATVETVDYNYSGATWSDERAELLGFATTSSQDGRLLRIERSQIGEACGAQLVQSERRDLQAVMFGYEVTSYATTGSAPFSCRASSTTVYECERTASCRAATRTDWTYDTYGNLTRELRFVDQGRPAVTVSTFLANPARYIVDRAYVRGIWEHDGAWKLRKQAAFAYDAGALGAIPTRGAVTAQYTFDDQRGTAVTTGFSYDALGNQITTTSPEGRVTRTQYDPLYHRYPELTCNDLHCTSTAWDYNLGVAYATTEVAGVTTVTLHDAHGRTITVTRPDGSATMTYYLAAGVFQGAQDARQRVRTEIRDGSPGDGVLWSEAFYDGNGRTYRTVQEGGATITTRYDDNSRLPAAVSEVHAVDASPVLWSSYTYDGLARPILITLPDGATRSMSYGVGSQRSVDEVQAATTKQFDGAGRTIAITDAVGANTRFVYDGLGRLFAIIDAVGSVSTTVWSSRDQQAQTTDPDRGTRVLRYTPDGALASVTDAKGQQRRYNYDALGRLEGFVDLADGNDGSEVHTVTYFYDDGNWAHGTSRGRVVLIEDQQGGTTITDELGYDAAGRVTDQQRCIDTHCASEGTTYDVAGRVALRIYPGANGDHHGAQAETVTYGYDSAGRLQRVGNASVSYATFTHYLDGQVATATSGNGVTETFIRRAGRAWLDRHEIAGPAGMIGALDYAHDAAARITQQTGSGRFTVSATYGYDLLGRLTSVSSPDVARREDLAYDAIGRLTYQRGLGAMRYEDPTHLHAMTSSVLGASRSYDPNGNVTRLIDPAARDLSIGWTTDNRIASITDNRSGDDHAYTYDVAGRRTRGITPTGTSYYFSPRVERDDSGALVKSYVAGDRLIARDVGGALRYYHQDVAHNVRLITDTTGAVVEHLEYLAFGKLYNPSGTSTGNDITFASARAEAGLGLVLMGARTYDPTTGRFLSPDSLVPSLDRPQSLDRYAYVENDPINHWDPSGHMRLLIELRKYRINEESNNIVPADALSRYLVYDRGPSDGEMHDWHRANRNAEELARIHQIVEDAFWGNGTGHINNHRMPGHERAGPPSGLGISARNPLGAVLASTLGQAYEGDASLEVNQWVIDQYNDRLGYLLGSIGTFVGAARAEPLTAAGTGALLTITQGVHAFARAGERIVLGIGFFGAGFMAGTYFVEGTDYLRREVFQGVESRFILDAIVPFNYRYAPEPLVEAHYWITQHFKNYLYDKGFVGAGDK